MEKVKTPLSWILRIGLAGVFVYAGSIKFLHPDLFYRDIQAYMLVPDFISYFAAYFMPPFEIALGACMFIPKFLKPALLLLATLTVFFILAIASAWLRGLDISCGCFGGVEVGKYAETIFRDILILISICLIFVINKTKLNPDGTL